MAFTRKEKVTPKQARRTGYLVASFAVFVVVYSIYAELRYADFAKTALRVDARIVQLEAIREGKRLSHILHYEIDHRGKTYRFTDKGGGDTKLEELYAGSFNAFTGEDPPLEVGKTFGVLVNPMQVEDHRADRDKLTFPIALVLGPGLGVVFLSCVAAFLFWFGHEPKDATGAVITPHKARAHSAEVTSSREGGVLRIRARVDVPWPRERLDDDVQAKLRERMRQLKAERGEPEPPPLGVTEHAETAEIRLELKPEEDAQLYEARADFLGANGEQRTEVLHRTVQLRANQVERRDATVPIPRTAKTLRIVLVLADRSRWQHDIALG